MLSLDVLAYGKKYLYLLGYKEAAAREYTAELLASAKLERTYLKRETDDERACTKMV